MTGRYLSADELLEQSKRPSSELPSRGGLKDYAPDGSWLEERKLESFQDERRAALLEERVQQIDCLSAGEWHEDVGKVLVTRIKGKFWKNLGHTEDGNSWLYPEEALLLMDEGTFEVSYGGKVFSLDETRRFIMGTRLKHEHYHVFSHLCRLGYIVRRHLPIPVISKYEKEIGLDKYRLKDCVKPQKRKADCLEQVAVSSVVSSVDSKLLCKRVKGNLSATEELKTDRSSSCVADEKPVAMDFVYNITNNGQCSVLTEPAVIEKDRIISDYSIPTTSANRIGHTDTTPTAGWMHGSNTTEEIYFPDISIELNIMRVPTPDRNFLPPGVKPLRDYYEFDLSAYRKCGAAAEPSNNRICDGRRRDKLKLKSWAEYKNLTEDEKRKSSPVGILFTEDVKPLFNPFHQHLMEFPTNVIQSFNIEDNLHFSSSAEHEGLLDIVYDVYLPDSKFRKSSPGLPAVCLCIIQRTDMTQDFATIKRLSSELHSAGVTLMFAVVDEGDAAFYSFNMVGLPPADDFS